MSLQTSFSDTETIASRWSMPFMKFTALDFSEMTDKFKDGSSGPVPDMCPFTTMSEFNRSLTRQNRIRTQGHLANLLDVRAPLPTPIGSSKQSKSKRGIKEVTGQTYSG